MITFKKSSKHSQVRHILSHHIFYQIKNCKMEPTSGFYLEILYMATKIGSFVIIYFLKIQYLILWFVDVLHISHYLPRIGDFHATRIRIWNYKEQQKVYLLQRGRLTCWFLAQCWPDTDIHPCLAAVCTWSAGSRCRTAQCEGRRSGSRQWMWWHC